MPDRFELLLEHRKLGNGVPRAFGQAVALERVRCLERIEISELQHHVVAEAGSGERMDRSILRGGAGTTGSHHIASNPEWKRIPRVSITALPTCPEIATAQIRVSRAANSAIRERLAAIHNKPR